MTTKEIMTRAAEQAGDLTLEIAGKHVTECLSSNAPAKVREAAEAAGENVMSITGTALLDAMGLGRPLPTPKPKNAATRRPAKAPTEEPSGDE